MEKRKRKEQDTAAWKTLPIRAGIGGAAGGAACVTMLLIWAALISSGRVGEGSMGAAGMVSGFLAGAVAGRGAARGTTAGQPVTGLCAGVVLCALLLAGGVLAYAEEISLRSVLRLLLLCGGGGVLSVLPVTRRKKRRR